ncbi:hypothetical protein Pint_04269 [Pistacia integerrima]|uniref:Uncharacterized protein n=1 Tax=Pistacia integerrima TaxID=434235 RepID=A0ACC0Z360_9ROSI|nr:hypothetical protein Pint_04269 [Pistacia integerrima]
METIGTIIIEAGKGFTIFFWSKIAPLRNLHGKIKALQTELQELIARKDEIEEDIRIAESEGKCPTAQAKEWLRKVQEIQRDGQQILKESDRIAVQGCGLGCNIHLRHQVGRNVAKKRDKVKQLIDTCHFQHVATDKKSTIPAVQSTLVSNLNNKLEASSALKESFNIVIWVTVPRDLDLRKIQSQIAERLRNVAKKRDKVKQLIDTCNFQHVATDKKSPIPAVQRRGGPSLCGQPVAEEMLEQLERYLHDDGIKRIAVWGMGGVGKSTLVGNLNNEASSVLKESFDIVIWVTVPRDLDLRKIQSQIAERLRLELDAEETVEQRAGRLFERLRMKKKFLLILDDVWEKIDLDIVGIPHDQVNCNCKILLTTRSLDVCRHMMTNKEVKMNVLNEEAAWNLFAGSAGNVVQIEDINPLARAIARKCCGLPLAIITVGKSMRNKTMKELWMNALCELQRSAAHFGSIEKDVYQQLKWSYSTLPSKVLQWSFLHCSLYPENFSIETSGLIKCWIADGLIDENQTREESFNNGIAFIEKLKDSCLLEQGESGGTVRMHNIVRDVGVWISKENGFFCQSGVSLHEMPQKFEKSFTRISFMHSKITKLPTQLMGCSELTVLLLQGNPITRIPDNFFREARALRVLNLSSTFITSLPPLIHLVELRALLLRNCYSLENLPSLGALCKLQELDLFGTQLRELPREMGSLSSLRELNLSGSHHLEIIQDGAISGLSSLEALEMSFSAYKGAPNSNAEGRAGLKEIFSLEQLSVLHLQLDSFDNFAFDAQWLRRLRKFNICIGPRSSDSNYLPTQHDEKRVVLRGVDLMGRYLDGLLSNSSALVLVNCGGKSTVSELVARKSLCGLPGLKSLTLSSCSSIIRLISGKNVLRSMLPNLESLTLMRLRNFGSILVGMTPRKGCLRRLRTIEVVDCPRLRNLVSFALIQEVQNLEEIRISDCGKMKSIFIGNVSCAMLSKLRIIELRDLRNLRNICSRAIAWPVLEKIDVSNCPKLTKLPVSASSALTIQEIIEEA